MRPGATRSVRAFLLTLDLMDETDASAIAARGANPADVDSANMFYADDGMTLSSSLARSRCGASALHQAGRPHPDRGERLSGSF